MADMKATSTEVIAPVGVSQSVIGRCVLIRLSLVAQRRSWVDVYGPHLIATVLVGLFQHHDF